MSARCVIPFCEEIITNRDRKTVARLLQKVECIPIMHFVLAVHDAVDLFEELLEGLRLRDGVFRLHGRIDMEGAAALVQALLEVRSLAQLDEEVLVTTIAARPFLQIGPATVVVVVLFAKDPRAAFSHGCIHQHIQS